MRDGEGEGVEMVNRGYVTGAVFERFVVNLFRRKGFCAMRSAGSKSPIDVCSWDGERLYFIQCKVETGVVKGYRGDLVVLRGLPVPSCGVVQLWVRRGGDVVIVDVASGKSHGVGFADLKKMIDVKT